MAALLKVLINLADIKSAGGVALRVRTQARMGLVLGDAKIGKTSKLEFFAEALGLETGGLAGTHLLETKARLPTEEPGARWVTWVGQNFPQLGLSYVDELLAISGGKTTEPTFVTDEKHCVGASDDYSRPGRPASVRYQSGSPNSSFKAANESQQFALDFLGM